MKEAMNTPDLMNEILLKAQRVDYEKHNESTQHS
jgi:hypothetical protein